MERYELPEGWEWTTIPTVGDIIMGQSPPSSTYNSEGRGLPFYQGKADFGELHPRPRMWCSVPGKIAQAGDILMSVRAPVGPTNVANEDCCIGRGLCAMRPRAPIIGRYLLRYLRAIEADVASMGTGSTFTAISRADVESIEIPLPPLAEQRRIVARLDALLAQARDSRAALDRIPPLLKRARQAILAAAFRGDLTERDPADEPADALLARLRAERRRRWEDDLRGRGKDPARHAYPEPAAPDTAELPELPQGWAWTNMGNVFTVGIGGTPSRKRPDFWNGTIPWVSSGEVAFRRISATLENITEAGLHGSSAKVHPPGTVLLAMIGEGKTRGQAAILDIPAATNQNVASLLVSDTPILPDWVYWWLMASYADTRGDGSGGAQPALNSARVRLLPLPIAPLSEQQAAVEQLGKMFAQADAIEAAARLARRRLDLAEQTLLARAFRGELVPQDPTDERASALLARETESAGQAAGRVTRAANGRRRGRNKKQPAADEAAAVQGRLGV